MIAVRLSLLMFISFLVPGTVVPLYSTHLQALGFTPIALAACCATQALGVVLAAPFVSQMADRWFPANRCLVVSSSLAAFVLWGLSFAREPWLVFLLTAIFWLVCSPALLMVNTICFTHLKEASKSYGSVRMWGTLGWMVAGWVVGLWLTYPDQLAGVRHVLAFLPWDGSISDAFRLSAVFAVVLTLYGLTLPHTPPQPSHEAGPAPLAAYRLLRGRSFLAYAACLFGVCITLPFTTQATPLLLSRLGTSDKLLMPLLTVAQSTELLTLPFLAVILGRFGFRGSMTFGLGAWAIAMTILAIGEPWALVVGSLVLNGLCLTCFVIAGQVYVNQQSRADLRASVQGILNCINGVGMIFGHLLIGVLRWAHNGNLQTPFIVAALVTVCLMPIFLLGFREPVRPVPPVSPAPSEDAIPVQGENLSPSSIMRA